MNGDLSPSNMSGPMTNGDGQAYDPESTATQLFSSTTQIDIPLRVEPPSAVNAMLRVDGPSRDEKIKSIAFSPMAHVIQKNGFVGAMRTWKVNGLDQLAKTAGSQIKNEAAVKDHTENRAAHRNAVSDYNMLAFASLRAGRHEDEGLAHYSIGVTLDNCGQFQKAIEQYTRFLRIAKSSKDSIFEALALNCLGVDHMYIACPPSMHGFDTDLDEDDEANSAQAANPLTQSLSSTSSSNFGSALASSTSTSTHNEAKLSAAKRRQHLQASLDFHHQHLNMADDGGQFVARTNIALCHTLLKAYEEAAASHQEALRIAIRLQSTQGQAIAVGNLGSLARRQGDFETARACMEQYLDLVQTLNDGRAQVDGWTDLGYLSAAAGEYEGAVQCFDQAKLLAEKYGEISTIKRLNCNIGLVKGNMLLGSHMADLYNKS